MDLNQKIEKDLVWMEQAKIKRLTSTYQCPKRYLLEDITAEIDRHYTKERLYENYLEYHTIGLLPEDKQAPIIPELKKLNKGSYVPAVRQRLDSQIENFKNILAKNNIKIVKTGFEINWTLKDGIVLFGTLDCIVEYNKLPYILDIKMTHNVHNDFGDFAWGMFKEMHPTKEGVYVARFAEEKEGMDLIQPFQYSYMMEMKTKTRWGFLYAVFDHKPIPEHKIIEVVQCDRGRESMLERVNSTQSKLKVFKEMNYEPIPSDHGCKGCKALCDVRYVSDDITGSTSVYD